MLFRSIDEFKVLSNKLLYTTRETIEVKIYVL
jgi:hypothetical protein